MAISAYVGVPGSGKSYEVVKSVILPAVMNGRRVVSNIYGLNEQKIKEYLLKKNKKLSINDLGSVAFVTNEQCLDDKFLPSMDFKDSYCKSGDLVVIDEIWRIWGSDKEIPKNHRSFIAEHRHFSDEKTGFTCDLVVINQNVAQIPRFVKDRVETTYRMQKFVSLGFRKNYRVDVFQGIKLTKANRVNSFYSKYKNEIFDLYKSYESDNALESVTDKRQSIWSSAKIPIFVIFILVFGIFGYLSIKNFFPSSKEEINTNVQLNKGDSSIVDDRDSKSDDISDKYAPKPISKKWRITGELSKNNKKFVILVDEKSQLRLEPKDNFLFGGRMLQGEIDGEIVNYYSGASK